MKWMQLAWDELGIAEVAGQPANAAILAYFRDAGHAHVQSDETAWCAAFVGAMLKRSGIAPTGSLRARSYETFGAPCDLKTGALVVLKRTSDPSLGHVGFCVSFDDETVTLIGGNQSNRVSSASFPRRDIVAVRWPEVADIEEVRSDVDAQAVTRSAAKQRTSSEVLAGSRTIRGALWAALGTVLTWFDAALQLMLETAGKVADFEPIKPMLAAAGANIDAIGLGCLIWGFVWIVLGRLFAEKAHA